MSELEYQRPQPSNSGLTQLTIAAIILMCDASLAALWSIVDGIGRIPIMMGKVPSPVIFGNAPTMGWIVAFFIIDLFVLLMAPLVIFGAAQMLRRKMYGFARFTAVLAMLPIATHCCCAIGLPIGIWTMVVLNRPDVKGAFMTPTLNP